MYEKLLRTQAENAFESVKDFGIKEYIQWFLSNKTSNTTVQPDPEAAADFVRMLKEQNRSSGSRRGDIFNQGLRENSESNLGVTDPNEGHQTQVYPDNYRVSRDGENGVWHWTNQNLPKGHPDRHNPPEDTRTQP
jgi:hypothetical protein